METICKETFGKVSAYRHWGTKEGNREREGRNWKRSRGYIQRYRVEKVCIGAAYRVAFWPHDGLRVKANTKYQIGSCRSKVDTHALTANIWHGEIPAAPPGRVVGTDITLSKACKRNSINTVLRRGSRSRVKLRFIAEEKRGRGTPDKGLSDLFEFDVHVHHWGPLLWASQDILATAKSVVGFREALAPVNIRQLGFLERGISGGCSKGGDGHLGGAACTAQKLKLCKHLHFSVSSASNSCFVPATTISSQLVPTCAEHVSVWI